MDPITHLTLGACTGELILGKKLGKKAMLLGAIAANIPDVDIIAGLFVRPDRALLLHRGITHSLLFALVVGFILALVSKRIWRETSVYALAFFFCFELTLHDLLDTCTSYGTGLLEPFSHERFSVHLLYVVDPLFTISLIISSIYLIWGVRYRVRVAGTAIIISALYLCLGVFNKLYIDNNIKPSYTTPAPFTNFFWYCINKTDTGYYTGYVSVFDKAPINYAWHPRNDTLLKQAEPALTTFADGYYTISRSPKGNLYFNIIRFGQIQGWQNADAPFALSFPLVKDKNKLVVHKGRLAGWNMHSLKKYIERIEGQ